MQTKKKILKHFLWIAQASRNSNHQDYNCCVFPLKQLFLKLPRQMLLLLLMISAVLNVRECVYWLVLFQFCKLLKAYYQTESCAYSEAVITRHTHTWSPRRAYKHNTCEQIIRDWFLMMPNARRIIGHVAIQGNLLSPEALIYDLHDLLKYLWLICL